VEQFLVALESLMLKSKVYALALNMGLTEVPDHSRPGGGEANFRAVALSELGGVLSRLPT
jgi:hypothetical protein